MNQIVQREACLKEVDRCLCAVASLKDAEPLEQIEILHELFEFDIPFEKGGKGGRINGIKSTTAEHG